MATTQQVEVDEAARRWYRGNVYAAGQALDLTREIWRLLAGAPGFADAPMPQVTALLKELLYWRDNLEQMREHYDPPEG